MKIGIIGAGIAGLAAAKELSMAGHDVTIIEKSRVAGGRLSTLQAAEGKDIKLDSGIGYLTARSVEFRGFLAELLDKKMMKLWGDHFWQYDGEKLLRLNPNTNEPTRYVVKEGMDQIAKYLSRWSDIMLDTEVGGLTYLGSNRGKKRSWMINLKNFNTFEADAVVVATPAPQAYGIILTTQDETITFRITREIDDIDYEPAYTLMAGYGEVRLPEWDAITCQNSVIKSVINENSKRDLPETALVIQSTPEFARSYRDRESAATSKSLLDSLADVSGSWAARPQWHQLSYNRYFRCKNPLNRPYMDFEINGAPLAVIGDYFEGVEVDDTYRSGIRLARHWNEKYKT